MNKTMIRTVIVALLAVAVASRVPMIGDLVFGADA